MVMGVQDSPRRKLGSDAWARSDMRCFYGVTVRVRANASRRWDEVLSTMPRQAVECATSTPDVDYSIVWAAESGGSDVEPEHALYRGDGCVYRTSSAENLLHALQADLTWSIASRSSVYMFVHAGAVAYRGRGVILPGVSGAGKSTLVSRLLARGCDYYSDEYAVMSRQGELNPFPCLVKLKDRPWGHQRVPPDEFGVRLGRSAVEVALVVFPTYAASTGIRIEDLSGSRAALRLLEHMPRARSAPEEALTCAAATTFGARCLSLEYQDSEWAADYLTSQIPSNAVTTSNVVDEGAVRYA